MALFDLIAYGAAPPGTRAFSFRDLHPDAVDMSGVCIERSQRETILGIALRELGVELPVDFVDEEAREMALARVTLDEGERSKRFDPWKLIVRGFVLGWRDARN
mgnify:CR=1 FL=1